MTRLSVFFDGACGPGGVAAYGFIVKNEESEVIHSGSGRVGRGRSMSSNVAEYEALYQSMLWIRDHHPKAEVLFHGDSILVISQMNGESKARSGKYLPYYEKTQHFAAPFMEARLWKFKWVARSFNSEADELSQCHRY